MKKFLFLVVLVSNHLVLAAQFGEMEDPVVLGHNSTPHSSPQLHDKRGFHEELPLIYVADDDHPSDHYWTKPYFPSRQ